MLTVNLLIPKLPIPTPTPKHSQAFDWSFSPYSGNLEICPVGHWTFE